jgi:hypothetical protein
MRAALVGAAILVLGVAAWLVVRARAPNDLAEFLARGGGRVTAIEYSAMWWGSPDGTRFVSVYIDKRCNADVYSRVMAELPLCKRYTGRFRRYLPGETWTFLVVHHSRMRVVRLSGGSPPEGSGFLADYETGLTYKGRTSAWEEIYDRLDKAVDTSKPIDEPLRDDGAEG